LLLWGEQAVGKTTLMVTGLLAYPDRLPPINWMAEPREEKEKLHRWWRELSLNQNLVGTMKHQTLTLELTNGNRLLIRDIQGLLSRKPLEEESFRRAGQGQGVLFVCEWAGPSIANHLAAVEAALTLCRGIPFGLALTKSEKGLSGDDPHWHAPAGWWRQHACWRPYTRILEAFGDRVWPTSAFGFDEDGRSCCLLDEFGLLMPYQIRPRNVEAPFRWFLQELGLWQA
jgi:hypothetical protein